MKLEAFFATVKVKALLSVPLPTESVDSLGIVSSSSVADLVITPAEIQVSKDVLTLTLHSPLSL
jgi:hypothetical protein